ncbi:MAG: polysaccharide deacetylase family protein [Oscillospiraceae bacterium]
MKAKKIALTSYVIIFFACVWSCSNTAYMYMGSEYQKAMETFKYQLGNGKTYSYTGEFQGEQAVVSVGENGEILNISQENAQEKETTGEAPQEASEKLAYLTFDDGPSPRTEEILDILKKQEVKATFFVISGDNKYGEYMVRAAQEGHSIGVHSHCHRYKQIYKSVEDYLSDFSLCYDFISEKTGHQPTIFRFPGGSVNNFNTATRKSIVQEMSRRGFVYFDWNVESGDSEKLSGDSIYNNVINGCENRNRAVILMHDSINKKTTVEALERVIISLKEKGYTFCTLSNEVKPMIFKMK